MRVIKGVGALLVLIAGTFGVPAFLVIFVGDPLPVAFDWSSALAALTRPDDGSLLVGLITLVAWIAWLVFVVSVITEVVAVVTRHRLRVRVPGFAAPQRWVSGLVVAVTALVVTTPQLGHAEAPSVPSTASTQTLARPTIAAPQDDDRATGVRSAVDDTASKARAQPTTGIRYTVQSGDDLWSLAERFYGEGRKWRRIAAANPTVLTGGPDRLEPGWRLLVPEHGQPGHRQVRVERDDTLSTIAERLCGDADRWPELYEANQFQLDDPDELAVGVRLAVPASLTAAPDQTAEAGTDSAVEGDDSAPDDSKRGKPEADKAEPATGDDRATAARPGETGDQRPGEPDVVSGPRDDGRSADPAPASPRSESLPHAEPGGVDSERSPGSSAVDPVVAGIAGVGGLLAAAVIAGTRIRRRAQLQLRPVGRRIHQPSPAAQLAEAQLGRRQRPLGLRSLDLATRAIAAHCHRTGSQLPSLGLARVGEHELELEMTDSGLDGPDGFLTDGSTWRLRAADLDALRSIPGLTDAVRPYPALVTLGVTADGEPLVVDLEAHRLTSIDLADSTELDPATADPANPDPTDVEPTDSPGADPNSLVDAALAAVAVELACSPWAEELELVLVGTCRRLPDALGRHTVTYADELDPVLDRLSGRAISQRSHPSHRTGGPVAAHRIDPDLADPWTPTILIVNRRLTAREELRLRRLVLGEPPVSIAAVATGLAEAPCRVTLSRSARRNVARVMPYDLVFTPQLLSVPAATAVIDLVEATGRTDTTPAPWWFDQEAAAEPDPPDNVTYLGRRFGGWAPARQVLSDEQEGVAMNRQIGTSADLAASHPVLRLLGPVDLLGAAGVAPPRAAKQCLEYCAWLLEHPGTTANAMATALAVAEGTRRSNMSRLRGWLGCDDLDQPYLPDAYSGRIMLHPSVSSDWQRLQILTGRGINLTNTGGLEAALQLVRGAPLADAAPGQWHWAEGLRTDMISAIRDIGVELADRALADSDLQLARWAATRALLVAPGDELLIVARIKTEHRAGNEPEVERLTLQLAAQARSLEVDLHPETVDVLQEMMEGRVRARLA